MKEADERLGHGRRHRGRSGAIDQLILLWTDSLSQADSQNPDRGAQSEQNERELIRRTGLLIPGMAIVVSANRLGPSAYASPNSQRRERSQCRNSIPNLSSS